MKITVGQIYVVVCCLAVSILVAFLAGYTVFRFERAESARFPIQPVAGVA